METRKEAHPSARQLAAFALGKLTPDGRAKMQEHVAGCSTCSTFVSQTPRDTLVTLLRQAAAGLSARDQSTPGVRGASTFGGLSWAEKAQATPNAVPVPAAAPDVSRAKHAATSAGPSAADEIPAALREQTKYRVIRLLGRGGMGSVYEAYHERMDRRVAIKVINPSLVDNPEALKRFDQEVRAAARLHHPNVALAYDADGFGSLRALVMEFVPGQSLERYLAKQGALSVRQACDFIQQAAAGLNDAFKQGMVHRDLKPQNMMLTPEGKIKILDFGLAKLASERRQGDGLTRENALMGTAAYLAPEQALDAAKADVRADIYALGCTLYALLAGAPPFADGTEMKVLLAHQHDKHRPLIEARPDVPRELSALVDRMLAKDPAERPQTPAEVARALVPFVKGTGTTAAPAKTSPASPQPVGKATVEVPLADDVTTRRGSRTTVPARLRRTAAQSWTQTAARIPRAWRWPSLAGLLSLAFLFGIWGVIVLVRTPTGTIVIKNVPEGVEVLVDDDAVALTRDGDEVTIEAVPKGTHKLELTRGGKPFWTDDATIDFASQHVSVRYVPPLGDSATKDDKAIPFQGPPKLPSEMKSYKVKVVTGNVDTASTNASVYLTLIGTNGKSDEKLLDDPKKNDFERGASDDFVVKVHDLGQIKQVRIRHDNDGSEPGWFLEKILVREESATSDVEFPCHRWLALDADDKKIDRVLDASPRDPAQRPGSVEGQSVRDPNAPAAGDAQKRFPDGQIFAGTWKIDGDEIVQPIQSSNISAMAFGDPDWKDYNLNLQIKPGNIDRGYVFVSFNAQSEMDFRVLRMGTKSVRSRGLFRFRGLKQEELATDESPGSNLEGDQWHAVRIEVRGSYCKCFVNGAEVCENTDESCSIGKIGLGALFTDARFKDITITSADDKTILWKGLPKLPADTDKGAAAEAAAQKPLRPDVANVVAPPVQPEAKSGPANAAAAGEPAGEQASGTKIVGGTWKTEGAELAQTSSERGMSALGFGDPAWSRYNLTLLGKVDAGRNGFSIAWHVEEKPNPLGVNCRQLCLGAMVNHQHGVISLLDGKTIIDNEAACAGSLDRGRWYSVRIEVRGAQCTCFLDGEQLFHSTDERFTHGRIALSSAGTAYRFKDIKVASEDDKTVLWQRLPTLPE